MLITSKRCIIFNFFVILWYNKYIYEKGLLTKGGVRMYLDSLFMQWEFLVEKDAPDKLKQQIAEEIQKFVGQNEESEVRVRFTDKDIKIINETKLFLMMNREN